SRSTEMRAHSKDDLNFSRIALGRPSSVNPRSEAHRLENIGDPPVVAAVARWVEAEKPGVSLLVHIEKCLHVKSLDRGWRWHRRYEQVSHGRRIVLSWSAAGAGPDSTSTTGTLSRPDSATSSGTGTRCSRVASSLTRCWSRHRSCHHLLRGSPRRFPGRLRLRWLHRWNGRQRQLGHRRGIGSHSHELEMLFARACSIDAATTASRRSRSSTANDIRS